MKEKILKILCCPKCRSDLISNIFLEENNEIKEGILRCSTCNRIYPIYNFIPRMLEGSLLKIPPWFNKKHQISFPGAKNIDIKKINSSDVFGHKWNIASQWGYSKSNKPQKFNDHRSLLVEDTLEFALHGFKRRSFLNKEDIHKKLVLDAGCGVGRYSFIASDMGAEMVSLDITNAVDYAGENLRGKNVHLVQGDLSCSPFKNKVFDVVFCLEVIMHTPKPKDSFKELVRILKNKGKISVTAYAKGNFVYEFNNYFIRMFTTRMPNFILWKFSWLLSTIGRFIMLNKYLFAGVNAFARIKSNKIAMFDWYAPKVASHHTDKEIRKWFKENRVKMTHTDDPRVNPDSFHAKLYPKFAKDRAGRVKKIFYAVIPRWGISVSGIKSENKLK